MWLLVLGGIAILCLLGWLGGSRDSGDNPRPRSAVTRREDARELRAMAAEEAAIARSAQQMTRKATTREERADYRRVAADARANARELRSAAARAARGDPDT